MDNISLLKFSVSTSSREFIRGDVSSRHFSACKGSSIVDLRRLAINDTFELCQDGYPDRKLFYDTRTGLVFLCKGYLMLLTWVSSVRLIEIF